MLSTMFVMDSPNTWTKTSLLHPRVFVFYCSKLPARFSCPLMPANDAWDIWWYTFTSRWLTKHQDNQVEHGTTNTKKTRGLNWTRLRSTMAGEATARCGSCRWELPAWLNNVLWYHHVGTHAVHLEFNCPQSAKSDSLQKLVVLRHGYFTSCRSLKSSDHAAHGSAFCPLSSWRTGQTCQQRRLGSIRGFLSPKLFSISFASHVCRWWTGPSMTWAKMVELGTWQDAKNCSMSPLPSNRLSKTNQETCGKETANRTVFLFTPNPFQSFRGWSQRIAGTRRFAKLCVVVI